MGLYDDKKKKDYVDANPGIIRGKPYRLVSPAKYYPESPIPRRPTLVGKTYFVDCEDDSQGYGSRLWAYLMEKYTRIPGIKSAVEGEKTTLEVVMRGMEDLRLYSMAQGKHTFDLGQSGMYSLSKAFRASFNNAVNSALIGERAYYDLVKIAHSPILEDLEDEELTKIAQYVKDNCTNPDVAKVAAEMFMARYEPQEMRKLNVPSKGNIYNPKIDVKKELRESEELEKKFKIPTNDEDMKIPEYEKFIRAQTRDTQGLQSVKFNIVEVSMPIIHFRQNNRGYVAVDEGVVPRYIYRYPWGPMFSQKAKVRKAKGGTVVIDRSGSMHLTHKDVMKIVENAPVATVASYNGDEGSGTLFILAKGGRRATDSTIARSSIGGGNIVDLQSLIWLSRQQEPRIWVSDGVVTGYGDQRTCAITDRCHTTVRMGKIKQYHDVRDAVKELKAIHGLGA